MADPLDQSLEQQALDASQKALDDAQYRAQAAVDEYNTILAGNPNAASNDDQRFHDAQGKLETAKAQLAKAESDHANVLSRIAAASRSNATKSTDPSQQRWWASHADQAEAQADLYRTQAGVTQAKTDSEIQSAQQRAQAAIDRAQSVAQRVGSQNDRDQSTAFLNQNKAAQIAALTPTLIEQHAALTNKYLSQSKLAASQANQADARAAFITGPQAEEMYAKGDLTRAQADYVKQSGGAKIDDLVQKAGLDQAKADQIRAKLTNPQLVATEPNSPTRVTASPATGELSGQANPGYVNVQQQAIKDYYDAIESLKQQMAQPGSPITPAIGDAMMQGIKASAEAKLLGTDVLSYQKQQEDLQHQKQLDAVNLITSRLKAGNDLAGTFWDAASKAAEHGAKLPDLSGIDRLSQAYATEAYGGQGAMDQARAILQGLGPVQSPTDILTHLGAITHAENILKGGQGGTQQPPQAPQAPQPAPQNAPLPSGVSPMGMTGGGQSALPGDRYGAGGLVQPPPTDQPPTDENDPLAALLSGAGVG